MKSNYNHNKHPKQQHVPRKTIEKLPKITLTWRDTNIPHVLNTAQLGFVNLSLMTTSNSLGIQLKPNLHLDNHPCTTALSIES